MCCRTQAALDAEYMMGTAPGVPTEFWGFETGGFCDAMKAFTTAILADPKPPSVFSISYGWQGDLGSIGCKNDQARSRGWPDMAVFPRRFLREMTQPLTNLILRRGGVLLSGWLCAALLHPQSVPIIMLIGMCVHWCNAISHPH